MFLRNKIRRRSYALLMYVAVFCLLGGTRCFAMSDVLPTEAQLLLEVGMSAKPNRMVEPAETVLTFTITNISEMDVLNLYLSSEDGALSESIGELAAGETQSFSRTHSVTESELADGEITYIISHDALLQGDGRVDYTIHAAIEQELAQPEAEFTRQFSSMSAAAGGTVSITYRVRNSGNVALNNLQLRDSLGDFTGRIERLEVGESRVLINRVSINEACVSSATLSYQVEDQGDTLHSQTLADAPIALANAQIDAALSVDYAGFSEDTAEVVLLLSNEGNVDFRNILISDDMYGGVIADSVQVLSGSDPVEISAAYPLRESASFRWRISGTSETGERIDFLTDTVTLEPLSTTKTAELKAWAETQTPRIRRSGSVKVYVHIANEGNASVENAVLLEETLGEIRNFAVIPGGSELVRELDVHVAKDMPLQFSVGYTDAEGWHRTTQTEPLEIVIASDGVLPEGSTVPLIEFTGVALKIGGSSLFGILLLSAFTMLVILTVILLIATRRAKLEKRMRAAAEKQRRKEEMGRTNRFTPLRKKK